MDHDERMAFLAGLIIGIVLGHWGLFNFLWTTFR
jgi:hypothetical protein